MRNKQKKEVTKLIVDINNIFQFTNVVRLSATDFDLLLSTYPDAMHEHYREHGIEYLKNKMIYLIKYDKPVQTL